jgi:hypothetical protein
MANPIKRLTRGLRLLIDHIYTPINNVLGLLTTTGVPVVDYDKQFGTFRININIPYVNRDNKSSDSSRFGVITVPFVLPTFQELFTKDNSQVDNYELIEIAISQDTRAEGGRLEGITTAAQQNTEGAIIQNEGNAYTLYLSEHEMDAVNPSRVENEIFKAEIPEIALINEFSRANPYVQTGLSIAVRHDRSYLIEFVPRTTGKAFFSVTISLKLKRKLTTRDTGVAAVQNITAGAGATSMVPVTVTAPVGNEAISADNAKGVNTNFLKIDSLIKRKLFGGYRKSGAVYYGESLAADAGYEVIAVPMFGSWCVSGVPGITGAVDAIAYPEDLPWSVAGVGGLHTMDRAIVPLQYPITIHHVIIAANYTSSHPDLIGSRPTSPTFTNEVGVGLLAGIRAEDFAVQQVASASWVPATIGNYRIDIMNSGTPLTTTGYYWDLLSCPLVGAGGAGYFAQGNPVYAAKGQTNTNTRSNIGTPPAAPLTVGGEQALDIRWKISDSAADASRASANVGGIVVGWPGHWVYIIGKKHLR